MFTKKKKERECLETWANCKQAAFISHFSPCVGQRSHSSHAVSSASSTQTTYLCSRSHWRGQKGARDQTTNRIINRKGVPHPTPHLSCSHEKAQLRSRTTFRCLIHYNGYFVFSLNTTQFVQCCLLAGYKKNGINEWVNLWAAISQVNTL